MLVNVLLGWMKESHGQETKNTLRKRKRKESGTGLLITCKTLYVDQRAIAQSCWALQCKEYRRECLSHIRCCTQFVFVFFFLLCICIFIRIFMLLCGYWAAVWISYFRTLQVVNAHGHKSPEWILRAKKREREKKGRKRNNEIQPETYWIHRY